MTVYLVTSLPKMLYVHRIYMVLANPTYDGVNSVCVEINIKDDIHTEDSSVLVWVCAS